MKQFFKKIMRWLGFVGVKVALQVPQKINKEQKDIDAVVNITNTSKESVFITDISVDIEETHTYHKSVDEEVEKKYTLGEIEHREEFELKAGESKAVKIIVPFAFRHDLADEGGVLGGIGKLSNMVKGNKREYSMTASVNVKDVGLDPLDTVKLHIE